MQCSIDTGMTALYPGLIQELQALGGRSKDLTTLGGKSKDSTKTRIVFALYDI